jgi:hypothetical protein
VDGRSISVVYDREQRTESMKIYETIVQMTPWVIFLSSLKLEPKKNVSKRRIWGLFEKPRVSDMTNYLL